MHSPAGASLGASQSPAWGQRAVLKACPRPCEPVRPSLRGALRVGALQNRSAPPALMDYSAGAAPVRSWPGPARMAAQRRAAGAAPGRSAMAQWSKKKKKGQRRRRLGADPRAHSSDSDDGDFEVPAGDDARAPKVGERGGARGGRPGILPSKTSGSTPPPKTPCAPKGYGRGSARFSLAARRAGGGLKRALLQSQVREGLRSLLIG